MEANGSPAPIFETDDQTYVLVTLPAHELFQVAVQKSDQVSVVVNSQSINNLDDIFAIIDQVGVVVSDQVSDQVKLIVNWKIHPKVYKILEITSNWIKRTELFEKLNLSNHSKNRSKYLDPLIDFGWVEMKYPDTRTSPNQRYKITDSGKRLLSILKRTINK